MSVADRSMSIGLRAINAVAGLEVVERAGMRKPLERIVHRSVKTGARGATAAGRAFQATQKLGGPARQSPTKPRQLFDLTPTDEQQMLQEAFGDFGAEQLRPIAKETDTACAAPPELLAQTADLGATMLGVPEELGGATGERSAVTTALVAEKLAHGDMGLAAAILAPAAVATAISLWGDADQQARYLPPFTADDVPAAALAIAEPRPLFDPFELATTATRSGDGYVLRGAKSLVPRAADAELFVVAAAVEDEGPALFIVEAGAAGLLTEPEPAMGVRAAATGKLFLEGVEVGAGALLGGGERDVYADCIQRARLAWCALAVGTGQAVLDYLIPYVNERKAFGEPISHRQAVAFTVADIAIEVDGMRLTTLRAAALADQGKPFAREAAIARQLCSERGMQVGSDGVQMLGGHGYVKEYPVERWYRDLRAAGLMEGALLV
jgi:alkylation response protein AidB-like acyl-CoA dehydrogenase